MNTYQLCEKFISINGEGERAGEIAVFLRFHGCNLNCSYCDTTWANQADTEYDIVTEEEIITYLQQCNVRNVTITGGEPLLQDKIAVLINKLGSLGYSVEIETNGSIPLNLFSSLEYRPQFTMDYKLPGSGEEKNMCVENFQLLQMHDVVKFVISDLQDLSRAHEIIDLHHLTQNCKIYFSPVFGKIDPKDMVTYMIDNHLNNVKLQLQLHKIIWDPNKRGV